MHHTTIQVHNILYTRRVSTTQRKVHVQRISSAIILFTTSMWLGIGFRVWPVVYYDNWASMRFGGGMGRDEELVGMAAFIGKIWRIYELGGRTQEHHALLSRALGCAFLVAWGFGRKRRRCRRAEDFGDRCSHIQRGASYRTTHCEVLLAWHMTKQIHISYHWIIKPSLSLLLQTHLVVPLLVLGVTPSGSEIVVGDIFAEEL